MHKERRVTSNLEQINGETSCLQFDNHRFFHDLLGHQDEHLHGIENALGVKISAAGTSLIIAGDKEQRALAGRVATQLYGLLQGGYPVYPSDVDYAIRILSRDHSANLRDIFLDTVYISAHRRTITPKSIAQKAYIDAIRRFDIVFGIGPAGTGKTYLAMAVALAELMKHKVSRVVLTRPAVEAGEKLGFLPGDLAEKMFLTRLGYGSKAVITGDITQIDLPAGTRSGLKEAHQILQHIDGIKFIFFSEKDVVRHRLVQDVITAYERAQEEKERAEQERKALRRSRAQARYDDRGLWQGARGEPDRATAVGPDGSAAPEPDAGRTQPGPGDGPRDPRPEPPVSGEGQTD